MAEATLCKVSSRQRSRVAGRSEFEALMRANQGRIVRLAAAMLHDRDAAEDVAQETFIRAFRFGENFRNEAAFSTWIYRIALNLCLDARRKARRSDSIDDVDDDAPDLPDPAPGPEALFSAREWARHTDEALDKLSYGQGTIAPEHVLEYPGNSEGLSVRNGHQTVTSTEGPEGQAAQVVAR